LSGHLNKGWSPEKMGEFNISQGKKRRGGKWKDHERWCCGKLACRLCVSLSLLSLIDDKTQLLDRCGLFFNMYISSKGKAYSLALGSSFASIESATFRRWILPVAVLGISFNIQTCIIVSYVFQDLPSK
jgi:hypothetical protein